MGGSYHWRGIRVCGRYRGPVGRPLRDHRVDADPEVLDSVDTARTILNVPAVSIATLTALVLTIVAIVVDPENDDQETAKTPDAQGIGGPSSPR